MSFARSKWQADDARLAVGAGPPVSADTSLREVERVPIGDGCEYGKSSAFGAFLTATLVLGGCGSGNDAGTESGAGLKSLMHASS
ncbi:hypothetical protein Adi01nite_33700 [Amorphoplanes digitatis]|nr:hypothetical protein GCM10020092_079040 [Actinoplanes digitatis]GID93958.1 hypothetical protein Adi01nite_33700 [Actinoplanes digitatis]